MTRLLALLLVAALIGIAFSIQGSQLGRDWVLSRLSEFDGGYTTEECEKDLVDSFNASRAHAGLPKLTVDEELQAWLRTEGSKIDVEDTSVLVEKLQASDLCYSDCYVTSAKAVSKRALVHLFDPTAEQSNAAHTSIGTVTRPVEESYGYEVLLVVGRKLKAFKPELLSDQNPGEFAVTCPHCNAKYGLRAQPSNGSLFLRCPKCTLNGGVLATDALGSYRWANEFLIGYQPPAFYPADITREHEMFIVWNAVAGDCAYRTDATEPGTGRDAWQTPLETMVRGQGDCEDTAILLTDWLIARGFNARVAIGKLKGGGHAWCVVKVDGTEYLLESTNASPDLNNLPYAEKIGKDYVPETLFDRDHIYVPARGVSRFGGHYFSEEWTTITPRPPEPAKESALATSETPTPTGGSHPVLMRAASGISESPVVVPLPQIQRLADIATGNEAWQLTKPFAAARTD